MKLRPLLLLLALAASACGGAAAAPDPVTVTTLPPPTTTTTTTTTAIPTTTTTAPTTSTTGDPGPPAPLTGQTGDVSDQQVLIAKLSNATKGRPQTGINESDLVMEVLVEGGVGRWLAVFQTTYPEIVGPLRSLREVDPKLIAPFDARILSSGGQASVRREVRKVASDESDGTIPGYFRERGRPAVYDLMYDLAELPDNEWDGVVDRLLDFDPRPRGPAEEAVEIEVRMSTINVVSWVFDHGRYRRFQDSEFSADSEGAEIAADSVVVVWVRQLATGRVDSAGSVVPDYEVVGSGPVHVFRDGVVFEGEWVRDSIDEFFAFQDVDGDGIPLAPGRTWLHITPLSGRVDWS